MPVRVIVMLAAWALVIASPVFADVVVTEKDAGKTIDVAKGEPLVVKLVGRHGSGYYWRLDTDLTPQLILSGRTTRALDLPGAPEETAFSFETEAPGRVEFRASNLKAGAAIPNGPSDFGVTVNIRP